MDAKTRTEDQPRSYAEMVARADERRERARQERLDQVAYTDALSASYDF